MKVIVEEEEEVVVLIGYARMARRTGVRTICLFKLLLILLWRYTFLSKTHSFILHLYHFVFFHRRLL